MHQAVVGIAAVAVAAATAFSKKGQISLVSFLFLTLRMSPPLFLLASFLRIKTLQNLCVCSQTHEIEHIHPTFFLYPGKGKAKAISQGCHCAACDVGTSAGVTRTVNNNKLATMR